MAEYESHKESMPKKVDKNRKHVNDMLMFFTAMAGGVVTLILIFSILYLISKYKNDESIIDSNKWWVTAWLPAEMLFIVLVATTRNLLIIIVGVILSAVIIFLLGYMLPKDYAISKRNKEKPLIGITIIPKKLGRKEG